MVTETKKVKYFQVLSVAGLSILFMNTHFYYTEIILAVLFCVFLWVFLWMSRILLFIYGSVLIADLLLLHIDAFTLIFVVAFLIVLYELLEYINIHSVKTEDEGEHKNIMNAHIKYIGALFIGCSFIPSITLVIARIFRIQIGYNIPLNILIFSAVVFCALLVTRFFSR